MDTQESDFEVEATDLNTGANIRHPLAEKAAATNQRDGGSRLSWVSARTRRMRAVLVTSVVLLAVALVTLVDPSLRSSLSTALLPPPAPSATLAADANLVFLESGAPWGAYSLDGLETSPLVQPGTRTSSVWIRLTPGRHMLRVTQPPFPSLRCTISLPAARSDTCPVVSTQNLHGPYFGNQSELPPHSRVIDLGARLDRLPPDEASALFSAARTALSLASVSQPTELMPGDHYLRDDGSVAVARTPLQTTLQLELASPDSSIPSDSSRCQSLCDALTDAQEGNGPGGLWRVDAVLRGSWRVTTPDGGQVIANHAPLWPNAALYRSIPQSTENLRTPLNVGWDGAWHILQQLDFSFGDPSLLDVTRQMVSALLTASPTIDSSGMSLQNGQGLNANQGWAISLTLRDPSATTPLILYYHFGVLLAANDAAHRAFSGIPVASANERALAQSTLGRP